MKKEDHVLFYKLEFNDASVPEVTACVRINQDLYGFLHLINVWWTVSNAKVKSNSRYSLGNAALAGDGKSDFLLELAD